MNKKHTLKKSAATLLALALTIGATGCNFLVVDAEKDLAQVVADVNIADNLAKDTDYQAYAAGVRSLIEEGGLSTEIPKRDLLAYYLSVGYNYVNSYGYSYEDTFNMLMDGLVSNKIMTQYAVAYYLKNGAADGVTAENCLAYVEAEQAAAKGIEAELLKAHPEVSTMKYFLTDGGKATATEDYDKAVYSLKQSLNASLDTAEAEYIKASGDEHTHDDSRTTPSNVDIETDDYYPLTADGKLDYDVYTGRNALDSCGEYKKVDGSTASTRKRAYNMFLSNLENYGLISKQEDTAFITELDYYYVELSTTLAQALVQKFYEDLKDDAIDKLTDEYVSAKYSEIMGAQEYEYTANADSFVTALDGLSDDSFVLYGQQGFGFVYNILLPFSVSQEQAYSAAKNKGLSEVGLYEVRESLLASVEAKDLRNAWFCDEEDDSHHYAYTATGDYYKNSAVGNNAANYLFFENNFKNTAKYESLTQYAGAYPYNGKAELVDDEWSFTPNKLKIGTKTESGFIQEMESYINYVLGGKKASGNFNDSYGVNYKNADGEVDYNAFIYYQGKVDLEKKGASDFFNPSADSYKALSAVNELMFAYSTDTGCLNTYMGYAVSPYKTDFVPEFEYAAQKAVQAGVGSYVVCPSDYGWHIIYTSFAYNGGDVYGGFKTDEKETEGTFSYMFYESLKSSAASNYTTEKQNTVLNQYKTSATYYTERYQDLLDLDKK